MGERQIGKKFPLLAGLVVWLASLVVLVGSGPFGTFSSLSTWGRIEFWGVLSAAAICIGVPLRKVFGQVRLFRGFPNSEIWFALGFTTVMSPVFWLVTTHVFPNAIQPKIGFGIVVVTLFVLSLARSAIIFTMFLSRRPARIRPTLRDRLPADIAGDIHWIESDDHYLNVHTTCGSKTRILMRLSDAVEQMQGVPGHCSHRSHWVSEQGIVGYKRDGRREFLVLICGSEVPIGGKYRPELEAAGFLKEMPIETHKQRGLPEFLLSFIR